MYFNIRAGETTPLEELEWIHIRQGRYMLGSNEDGAVFGQSFFELDGFYILANEVTVDLYCMYLNAAEVDFEVCDHPQISIVDGKYVPASQASHQPVAYVDFAEALAFCRWLGDSLEADVRLPTEIEWEAAARGGIMGARFPWGWGDPRGRSAFDADLPGEVRRFAPNPYGIYDMAGSLFEWCEPSVEYREGRVPIRGGSWSERDPRFLRVFNKMCADVFYRGADVGFRPAKF